MKDLTNASMWVGNILDPLNEFINKDVPIEASLFEDFGGSRFITPERQRYFFEFVLFPYLNWKPRNVRAYKAMQEEFVKAMGDKLDVPNQPAYGKKMSKFIYDKEELVNSNTSRYQSYLNEVYETLCIYPLERHAIASLNSPGYEWSITIDKDFKWTKGFYGDNNSCYFSSSYSFSLSRFIMAEEYKNIFVAKVNFIDTGKVYGSSRMFLLKDMPFPGAFILTNGYTKSYVSVLDYFRHLFPHYINMRTHIFQKSQTSLDKQPGAIMYFNQDGVVFFPPEKADILYNRENHDTIFPSTDQSGYSFHVEKENLLELGLHYDVNKYHNTYVHDPYNEWYKKGTQSATLTKPRGETPIEHLDNQVAVQKERKFGNIKLTL